MNALTAASKRSEIPTGALYFNQAGLCSEQWGGAVGKAISEKE